MVQGRRTALVIELSPQEKQELERWQRSRTIRAGLARRGRIIVALAECQSISQISRALHIRRKGVYLWARRFLKERLDGLADRPGRGRKPFFPPGSRRASGAVGL
jgi:hypothetical protein